MKMNIAFSCDEKYAAFLATTMASILLNSAEDDTFSFHVLDGGLSRLSKAKIAALRKHKDFSIEYIPFDYNLVANCPIMAHFSKAAYFRFFIADLIPDAGRVLYLDVDLIILTSLAPLYSMDIGKNIVAAVPRNRTNRLGIEGQLLFNSGVMIQDTAAWRKWKIADKLIATTEKIRDKIEFVDQDVLNYFFHDKYTHIDKKWNVKQQELIKTKNANIIHFSGKKFAYLEYSKFLFEYLDQTEFDQFNIGELEEPIHKEIYRNRQRKALVQEKANSKSVAFILSRMLDLTCLQSLIDECKKNEKITTEIYLLKDDPQGTVDPFVEKKLQESGLAYSIAPSTIPEEIVFLANPYLGEHFYWLLAGLKKKMVYIPYANSVSAEEYSKKVQYNMAIHNLAWRIYILDDFYTNMYKANCDNFLSESIRVIHTTPKFDQVMRNPLQEPQKIQSFLWNIHFDAIPDKYHKSRTWSAFFVYNKAIYNFFKKHSNIHLILRPHFNIYIKNIAEMLHELEKFQELPNAVTENSAMFGYGESLDKADAFITDISSMIIDMATTGKPIIMLTYEKSALCHEFAEKVFSSSVYKISNASEFDDVATNLIVGHDPQFAQRHRALQNDELFVLSRPACEIIMEDIFPD